MLGGECGYLQSSLALTAAPSVWLTAALTPNNIPSAYFAGAARFRRGVAVHRGLSYVNMVAFVHNKQNTHKTWRSSKPRFLI